MNQVVTMRMLQKLGCEAELACDGASATNSVEAKSFDIVLMDVHMPVVDGLEATRRIRRMPVPQSCVPIVALTASATNEDRSACLAAGMNDCLIKPIGIRALQQVLDRWDPRRATGMTPDGPWNPGSCAQLSASTDWATSNIPQGTPLVVGNPRVG